MKAIILLTTLFLSSASFAAEATDGTEMLGRLIAIFGRVAAPKTFAGRDGCTVTFTELSDTKLDVTLKKGDKTISFSSPASQMFLQPNFDSYMLVDTFTKNNDRNQQGVLGFRLMVGVRLLPPSGSEISIAISQMESPNNLMCTL